MQQKSLIETLIEKKRIIQKEKHTICMEMIKCRGLISKHGKVIQEQKDEIRALMNKNIRVNVETLVENLAKLWNVAVEDLDIEVQFPTTAIMGKASKKDMARIFGERKDISIRIYVQNLGNGAAFSTSLDLKAIQKNGEILYNCLDVEQKEENGYWKTNFVCQDYRNLVFIFSLNRLINFETNEYEGDFGRAAITAYEQDKAKEMEGNI